MPGLLSSEEKIFRDEQLSATLACLLFHHLHVGPIRETVNEIILEAAEIGKHLFEVSACIDHPFSMLISTY